METDAGIPLACKQILSKRIWPQIVAKQNVSREWALRN